MLPLMLNMYVGRLGEAGAPLHPRIQSRSPTTWPSSIGAWPAASSSSATA
jgi:hypothetical protein